MSVVLLSIIIPTFNSGKTLSSCLDSILSQTFKDFEVVIIDGLSTDETIDIIKSYLIGNPNIRYISAKDNGIYDAMNKGIKVALGEWLYFIGSDDLLYDNNVLATVFHQGNLGFDVIYGNISSELLGCVYDGEFNKEKLLKKNICHQAIFFKRNTFKKTGLFDTRYKAHADWDHNLKWFSNPNIKKKYTDHIIAHFAAGGLSSSHKDELFVQMISWEKLKFEKKKISRLNKLRVTKAALKNALAIGSKRQFFKIFFDVPFFIL